MPTTVITGMILDWAGSTRLHEDPRLGPTSAARAGHIRENIKTPFDELLRQVLAASGGRHVHTTGDGACCAYTDPQAALLAALVMQHRLQLRAIPVPDGVLQARVGLHCEAIPADAPQREYIHQAGNYAARAQARAPLGGVAVTDELRALCEHKLAGVTFHDLGEHAGKPGERPRRYHAAQCEPAALEKLSAEWQRASARPAAQPPAVPEAFLQMLADWFAKAGPQTTINLTNQVNQGVIGPVGGDVHFH